MIKHVVLWKLKEGLSAVEKQNIKKEIKNSLESLKDKIEGIKELCVNIDELETSNADLMLDSIFSDKTSLKNYAEHPEHVKIAEKYVKPNAQLRLCFDYPVL